MHPASALIAADENTVDGLWQRHKVAQEQLVYISGFRPPKLLNRKNNIYIYTLFIYVYFCFLLIYISFSYRLKVDGSEATRDRHGADLASELISAHHSALLQHANHWHQEQEQFKPL